MARETIPFDASEYLQNPEAVAAFLEDAFESGDVGFITHAVGVVARAQGMTELARQTGLSRASLYKALRDGANPELGTILKVLAALGVRLVPVTERELEGV